jgi:hypothetical protein
MKLEARLRAFATFCSAKIVLGGRRGQPAISKHIAELEDALGVELEESS